MLELFPQGFEELDARRTGSSSPPTPTTRGEERLWPAFGTVAAEDVAAGLGGALARVPPAGAHRPALGRPALGTAAGRRGRGRRRPGPAFGTGAHPTTRLCLELLAELERGLAARRRLRLGVLSIAAAKLGFAPVTRARPRSGRRRGDARRTPRRTVSTLDADVADALAERAAAGRRRRGQHLRSTRSGRVAPRSMRPDARHVRIPRHATRPSRTGSSERRAPG